MVAFENIRKNGLKGYVHENIKNQFAPVSLLSKGTEIVSGIKMIVNTSKLSIYNSLHVLVIRKDTSGTLPGINKPVLIFVEKEDIITLPAMAESMHIKMNGSQLNIIGHAHPLRNKEHPFEFNYLIRKFISLVYQTAAYLRLLKKNEYLYPHLKSDK